MMIWKMTTMTKDRVIVNIVLLAVLGLCSRTCGTPSPTQSNANVQVWNPFLISLNSSVKYAQPAIWTTVLLDGMFTHASGETFMLPGFWDGNLTWRLRFSPPLSGHWTYKTNCSDSNNGGLHGITGEFTANVYVGKNPLYLHGVLRPNSGGRYLEHADGTPFYWLGDTHWSGFSSAEHIENTDNTTFDKTNSMFKEMVDVRATQGYSVWKAETFVINGPQVDCSNHDHVNINTNTNTITNTNTSTNTNTTELLGLCLSVSVSNDGGPAWRPGPAPFGALQPGFWAAIDKRVAYVNSQGMVVSLAFAGIGRGMTSNWPTLEPVLSALARYSVARYAAYSTVWTTCQEYCAPGSPGKPNPASDAWARVAKLQYDLDPYKRSTSLHNCYWNPLMAWRNQSWYGHVTLQQGHNIASPVDHWLEQYNAEPPRVLIEDEANYELLKYASMTTNVPGWLTRQSAWQSQIGGAAGYTYGGQGIWWACYNRSYVNGNCGKNGVPGYFTWDQALTQFPVGGHQMSFMGAFWRSISWHMLAPDSTAIVWDKTAPTDSQRPAQKADSSRGLLVAYLPRLSNNLVNCRGPTNVSAYGGLLQGIEASGSHTLNWFNPRTSVTTLIVTLPPATLRWRIPATRPTATEVSDDWVLVLERATATAPQEAQTTTPQEAQATTPEDTQATSLDGNNEMINDNAQEGDSERDQHQESVQKMVQVQPQTARPTGSSWVTNVSLQGKLRTVAAEVGCRFTSASQAARSTRVTSLCRYIISGNQNVVTVKLIEATTSKAVASVDVDALGAMVDPLGFACTALTTPLQLQPSSQYYLVGAYTGCDTWYDDTGTVVTTVQGATANVTSVYGGGSSWNKGGGGANHCYGPLNFYFE